MARKDLSAGTLTAPLPPVLVTVGEGEDENVLTVAWTGIVSTKPPRTYVSVRPERHSYEILKRHREFTVNLPTEEMARVVDHVGIFTGAKENKFEKCGLTRLPGKEVGCPTIAECPLALECRVVDILPQGSHDMFLADIVNVSVDESIIDAKGKIRLEKAHLLAYAHGEYFALGRRLGAFGFSAAKKHPKGGAHNGKQSGKRG